MDARVTVRLGADLLTRADAVAAALSRPGFAEVAQADALRACLIRGLEAYEAELGLTQKPKRKPKPAE